MVWFEVLKIVEESYRRVGKPQRVLLGLSGGADSVALLRLLLMLRDQHGLFLACVHVNHGLRPEATTEEVFVRTLCEKHAVPLEVAPIHIPAGGNLEERARNARHAAFQKAALSFTAEAIALGHQQDDQAESVLLRLLHGTGSQGLASMREWGYGLWRPLLSVRSSTLHDLLQELDQPWMTDASNIDRRFARNRIRWDLMPLLEATNPAAVANIARTADILAVEDDYWARYAADWLTAHASLHPSCPYVLAEPLAQLHIAAQRQLLRRFAMTFALLLDYRQLEELRALLFTHQPATINLPGGHRAARTSQRLHLLHVSPLRLPLGNLVEGGGVERRKSTQETFDVDKLSGMVVRYREPGDTIHPLGAKGSKKLNDYLMDRKVDRPLRDHWPVCCKGQQVLWVPGVGMAQDAAVTQDTQRRVKLTYQGRLPDEYVGWEGDNS